MFKHRGTMMRLSISRRLVRVAVCAFGFLAGLLFSGNATGKLIDRGGGLIYDDVLNVTWTQNPSLVLCRALGSSDKWSPCVTWADALVYGGFDDWRLASMDVNRDGIIVDCSIVSEAECRDNEYGYMFYYNLGGNPWDNKTGDQTTADGVTINAIHRAYRWGNRDYFDFLNGQILQGVFSASTVWAVRDGDSALAIPVDVKPVTCENPLNVRSRGKFPVAIVGTANFDATTVDAASVRLVGVAPLRSSWTDVATPFEPFIGKDDALDCTLLGSDGFLDLELQFDVAEIVQA